MSTVLRSLSLFLWGLENWPTVKREEVVLGDHRRRASRGARPQEGSLRRLILPYLSITVFKPPVFPLLFPLFPLLFPLLLKPAYKPVGRHIYTRVVYPGGIPSGRHIDQGIPPS